MIGAGNPIFNENTYSNVQYIGDTQAMTVNGTINKTVMLLFVLTIAALISWTMPQTFVGLIMPMAIIALVIAFIIIFKKTTAPLLAPIYAFLEGLILGTITIMFEKSYPGIAFQAVGGTIAVFAIMLAIYRMQLIKVTQKFKMIIVGATFGVLLIYLVSFIMSFFGNGLSVIHAPTPLGIVFSIIVCGIAAFNFLIDFDNIEQGAAAGSPRYMEWFSAFGLMVTLIWLYLEILRLLAKLRSDR